jgi:hypothetical protein
MQFFYSKSTAVADGESGHTSLGGRISADQPTDLIARPHTLPGVTITKITGMNLDGVGSLVFTATGQTLKWKAPRDSVVGAAVAIGAGGSFDIESSTGDAWIRVTVTTASLPTINQTVSVIVDPVKHVLFDIVSAAEAMAGLLDYKCLFVKNTGASPHTSIRPHIEVPAVSTTVKTQTSYGTGSSVKVVVTTAANFPNSYFIRNTRTKEIMYYNYKSGSSLDELLVPVEFRGLRGTYPAQGIAGDVIELIAPYDLNITAYNPTTGASIIQNDKIAQAGMTFFYPDPSDSPHYQSIFSCNNNDVLTVWLKRTIPAGAVSMSDFPLRLGFLFD